MLAAIYQNFKEPLSLQQVPNPNLSDDGVILEVTATGICRSDWHGWMGHDKDISLPHVPGHEMCGVIVEKGKLVEAWEIGQRVTLPFVCGCGQCVYCRQGDHQVCDFQFQPGFTHWGSFAQFVHIKYAQHNLVSLPAEVSDITAASLGCRFATAYRALVDQAKIGPAQWVAVFGCGGIGLSAIMIAKAYDARVIAVDIDESHLELARELGAELIINSKQNSYVADQILEHTQGGAHITMDALGNMQVVQSCIRSLRKRGLHLQVGLLDPDERQVPLPMDRIVAAELQVVGSHGMQAYRYGEMLSLMEKGRLDPALLVTKEINLGKSPDALRHMTIDQQAGITVITDFSQ